MMRSIVKYVLIIAGIVLSGFVLWYFRDIVAYILIAGVLSLIGSPLVGMICNKIHIRRYIPSRALGAGLTLLLLWVFIFTFFTVLIPLIVNEANNLSKVEVKSMVEHIEQPLQSIQQLVSGNQVEGAENFSLKDYATDRLISILDVSQMSKFFGSFASVFGDIFIAIFAISFISFFFLKDEKLLGKVILSMIPQKYIQESTHVLESIARLLKRYFVGIAIEVLSVGILITIGLSIIGLKFNHILIIASFAAILNVIPYLGPIIGALFGLFIGFATNLELELYTQLLPRLGLMAIVFISVQIMDNIVFQPLIYSSSVNAHPLEIFLVILIGGHLAGILGMVLAIPVYTIMRVIAKEFFNNVEIVRKLTSGL